MGGKTDALEKKKKAEEMCGSPQSGVCGGGRGSPSYLAQGMETGENSPSKEAGKLPLNLNSGQG